MFYLTFELGAMYEVPTPYYNKTFKRTFLGALYHDSVQD